MPRRDDPNQEGRRGAGPAARDAGGAGRGSGDRWEIFDDDVLGFALRAAERGERFVLVTLVKIEGSSPRYPGAQMVVTEAGEWSGYLSGGCIERAVVAEALEALEAGVGRRVRYGKGSPYFDIQLPCGSAIELYFDTGRSVEELKMIEERLARRETASLDFVEEGATAARFVRHYRPRLRLVVLGVGAAAAQLCRFAGMMNIEVELMSPDEATREFAELGGANAVALTSMTRRPEIVADGRTAIVLMFHDHDWEAEALMAALASDAFYIGAMGSRVAHRKRVEALVARGVDEGVVDRVHAPIGLFPGSKNATEIALSVLAEIVSKDPFRAGAVADELLQEILAPSSPHRGEDARRADEGAFAGGAAPSSDPSGHLLPAGEKRESGAGVSAKRGVALRGDSPALRSETDGGLLMVRHDENTAEADLR